MYKALIYINNRMPQLSRYHIDGRYKIDNNPIERAQRSIAMGRKNYLFCQNNESAERTAIMYTMMGCCKLANVNASEWLTYVFANIRSLKNQEFPDYDSLLPQSLKKAGIINSTFMDLQKDS